MGIIKAAIGAVSGALADQWLEVIEPDNMGDQTVMTKGVFVRRDSARNSNTKGSSDMISNGSIIHVYPNQFMMLLDGGKVVDYTAEEGYYKVQNSSAPSLFGGQFGDAFKETFSRVKYGGVPSSAQKVFYINLQEIKGIKFGTRTPLQYFDNFYNSELFLRTFGSYSIRITDPMKFFYEACPRNAERVEIGQINEQYMNEFLSALQAAINQLSVDGVRISHAPSKSVELSKYMAQTLDDDWKEQRGFEVQSVGIASISYDAESQKLINMRNQGAMLSDAAVRQGYVQGAMARGFEAAGSNSAGAAQAFMGMGMGMGAAGNFMGAMTDANERQMSRQQAAAPAQQAPAAPAADSWTCACGAVNTGKFCAECGKAKPAPAPSGTWTCKCGAVCKGKFCPECGSKRPGRVKCDKCGYEFPEGAKMPKFCPECGDPVTDADMV
ncbi:MAG: SPFH domain-containing protein [Eubacteriales bacterium]|nr:SPFH domain-containing protein [Eubacteriales bacterium]MDY3286058.1 SPFH domain-containing protein [Eubacteriales bacterium]MDY5014647.1 SPFH domain-containing protein [Eubacteriales bacterium]